MQHALAFLDRADEQHQRRRRIGASRDGGKTRRIHPVGDDDGARVGQCLPRRRLGIAADARQHPAPERRCVDAAHDRTAQRSGAHVTAVPGDDQRTPPGDQRSDRGVWLDQTVDDGAPRQRPPHRQAAQRLFCQQPALDRFNVGQQRQRVDVGDGRAVARGDDRHVGSGGAQRPHDVQSIARPAVPPAQIRGEDADSRRHHAPSSAPRMARARAAHV